MLMRNILSANQRIVDFPTSAREGPECPGTGVVTPFVATGGLSTSWSANQDQLLRKILGPLGQGRISWQAIESTLDTQFPGKTLGAIKTRWSKIKKEAS